MGLVTGVVLLNALFLTLGYALLWGLRLRLSVWDAGLALVLGTGVTAGGVFFATIAGARANLRTVALVAFAVLALAGAARALRLPSTSPPAARRDPIAAVLAAAVAAVCVLAVVGGFRSSPWLDDAWGIWLPKAVALLDHGLDERLFAPSNTYVAFEVPDYPLWWSALTALDVRAVGDVDLRALNAQLSLLAVGFLGAAARLLWDVARPWVALLAPALLAFSPEFFRQTQGGVADLALGTYVALAALAGAVWITGGGPLHLVLAAVFAATAVQVKGEGLAEIAILLAAGLAVAPRKRPLLLAGGAALASALPWLVWQWAHDVPARTPLSDALDPTYLADRAERVGVSVREVVERAFDPTDWLVIVPLLIVLGAAAAVRSRRTTWLTPSATVCSFALFLVWAYWANRDEIGFLLATSAYRVVDPLVLTAAVLLPFEAERVLRS